VGEERKTQGGRCSNLSRVIISPLFLKNLPQIGIFESQAFSGVFRIRTPVSKNSIRKKSIPQPRLISLLGRKKFNRFFPHSPVVSKINQRINPASKIGIQKTIPENKSPNKYPRNFLTNLTAHLLLNFSIN
jgi:hypothetical protein